MTQEIEEEVIVVYCLDCGNEIILDEYSETAYCEVCEDLVFITA